MKQRKPIQVYPDTKKKLDRLIYDLSEDDKKLLTQDQIINWLLDQQKPIHEIVHNDFDTLNHHILTSYDGDKTELKRAMGYSKVFIQLFLKKPELRKMLNDKLEKIIGVE